MRTLEIVRRLTGCYYCGRPIRGRAEVCGFCSDLPLRDPLVAKARQVLSEAERIEASAHGTPRERFDEYVRLCEKLQR